MYPVSMAITQERLFSPGRPFQFSAGRRRMMDFAVRAIGTASFTLIVPIHWGGNLDSIITFYLTCCGT
jgi:hypothetical protein